MIVASKQCSGCYACVSACPQSCIKMKIDNEGFWYPEVLSDSCIDCGVCERVCPTKHKQAQIREPAAFAILNKDENVRSRSSSGGVFTVLAEHIIESGGVVFGAGFDEGFNVVHSFAEQKSDIRQFRGSKYVQSRIGQSYIKARQFLKSGRPVLFSGTPCQIAGLKSYLGHEYDNLFTVDLICHGVPSPKAWNKYLKHNEQRAGAPVADVNFRSKQQGWKKFEMALSFGNKMVYNKTLDKDEYLRAFLQNVTLRPSCYECNFKTLGRASDLTLADFWGVDTVMPELADDKGVSLVFVHSDKGKNLLDSISDKIVWQQADLKKAIAFNSAAVKPVEKHSARDLFFKDLDNMPFDALVNKYCRIRFKTRVRRVYRSVGSKAKRLIAKI